MSEKIEKQGQKAGQSIIKPRNTVIAITILALVIGSTFALVSGFGNSETASSSQEWEYLVVAVGVGMRADFSSAWQDKGGKVDFQEAVDTEKDLDKLGREGWELIDVVGVIGGDEQEFVFKRPK